MYYDKISGKIIITTYDSMQKIKKDDANYALKKENNIYLSLRKIIEVLEYDLVVSNDKIYVSDNEYIEAVVKNNRTEIYDNENHDIISFVQKGDKVKLVAHESVKEQTAKTVNILVTTNNISYYGYVLKENLQYEYTVTGDVEQPVDKIILVKAEDKLMSSTDTKHIDMVAINMYRLSGVNSLTKLEYTNNVSKNIQVYATINNGQLSSNYDADITSGMLNSESNRGTVIQKLLNSVKELAGVNIDFGSLKVSDKSNFTQFIRELAAVLHANGKKVIVNVPSTQYIDLEEITKAADYVILQPYTARTIASKTSGPISSIPYVENTLKDILNRKIDASKIILELPAYSILWTERKGTVINAERYNMQMIEEYISANNIKAGLDNTSGQNYINYTLGITTYKIWLEDEHSITEKTKLANKYNLAGVSIYRSGMELKKIYTSISNELNK